MIILLTNVEGVMPGKAEEHGKEKPAPVLLAGRAAALTSRQLSG
jgi:hypothetical protein